MNEARGGPAGRRAFARGPFGAPALRIGRVFGIEVAIDATWLLILGLVVWSLRGELAAEHEHWSPILLWGVALATSLLFFFSLLLHELGHSVTSNALGLPIHSITLFIFGGVARLTREPSRPRDEFLIAIAGPLVSLFLAFGFLSATIFIPEGESLRLEVAYQMLLFLGQINLALLIFNMIPGFPLDGGRVLRAAIWGWTGDFRRATRAAAAGGSVFAALLICLGAAQLAGFAPGGAVSGFWKMFIGWFIYRLSRMSVRSAEFSDALLRQRAGDWIRADLPRVSGALSLEQLISGPAVLTGARRFLVERDGEFLGLVTLDRALAVAPEERANTPVQAIQYSAESLVYLAPEETLAGALAKMESAGMDALPVARDGVLLGVIGRDDIARAMGAQARRA